MQEELDKCQAFIYDARNVLITNAPRHTVALMWESSVQEGLTFLQQQGYAAKWMTLQTLRSSELR